MRKISSLIDKAIDNFKPDDYQKRNTAVMQWEDIVGKELAAFVTPVGYDEAILLLRIKHPAAIMEIRLRKNEILKKLNSVWNEDLFTDLKKV